MMRLCFAMVLVFVLASAVGQGRGRPEGHPGRGHAWGLQKGRGAPGNRPSGAGGPPGPKVTHSAVVTGGKTRLVEKLPQFHQNVYSSRYRRALNSLAEDVKQGTPKDAKHEVPKDVRHEAPEDVTQKAPEDAKHEVPKDVRHEAPKDATHEALEDVRHQAPEDERQEAPEVGNPCTLHSIRYGCLCRAADRRCPYLEDEPFFFRDFNFLPY